MATAGLSSAVTAPPPSPGAPITPASPGGEEGLQEILARYERQGFRGQFGARPPADIICFSCRTQAPATMFHLLAMHRVEGSSDPGDEAAVAAVQCPQCRTKGTLSLTYGAGASPEDSLVLQALSDHRAEGPVRPGI
jgi:hypothetical protein